MKELKKLLSTTRQAMEHYDMIQNGDTVAVGLSGGKDSGALLLALAKLQAFYPKSFRVCAVTVDLGFPGGEAAYAPLCSWCADLGVPLQIVKTQIAQIVFEERKEKNPCALCAKLRRGALLDAAAKLGANKTALGHHMEDAAETFMLSLLNEGRIGCFSPVTVYENNGISVIRPLVYTRETDIKAVVRAERIPVIKSLCPEDGETEREGMKTLLREQDKKHRGLYKRMIGAMERKDLDGWHI